MEKETAGPDQQVPAERDQENLVMPFSTAIPDALDPEPDKQEVRKRIDDLGGVWGGIVVLASSSAHTVTVSRNDSTPSNCQPPTSSHQFKVDVTGLQYPAFDGGYGIKGKCGQ